MLRPAHLLRHDKLASAITANPLRLTILICVIWTLSGLVGRDPWKPDEAQAFAVAYHFLLGQDWVVPMLAGEPYLEKPPLVHLTAALFAVVFSPLLPLHDAARLATGFYMALTFLFVGLAAKELYGAEKSWVSTLTLLGCGGLLLRAHLLITEVALLAGISAGLFALAVSARRPVFAGLWLGIGLGVICYSTGLVEPLMLLIVALLLPAISAHWRTRQYALTLAIALVVALPWAIGWPLALHARAPDLFSEWFWTETVQRLHGIIEFGEGDDPLFHIRTLAWFAWPAWPLALWALWAQGRQVIVKPEFVLPLAAFVVFLGFLCALGEARDVYGLPLLIPLSLLAATGLNKLPRGAVNAYYWFAIMLFTFFLVVGWFYWMAIDLGVPHRLWKHMMKLQPEYLTPASALAIACTVLVTIGWLVLLFNFKRTQERPVAIWAAGVTAVWALVGLILVNYIDTGKTYRSMVTRLAAALPERHGCILSKSLGEPQRAMLYYFGDIRTERMERKGQRRKCDLLIVQDNWKAQGQMGGPWKLVWEGRRPGDKQERFRIYQRAPQNAK